MNRRNLILSLQLLTHRVVLESHDGIIDVNALNGDLLPMPVGWLSCPIDSLPAITWNRKLRIIRYTVYILIEVFIIDLPNLIHYTWAASIAIYTLKKIIIINQCCDIIIAIYIHTDEMAGLMNEWMNDQLDI